jgi:BolA family transcriptional regulator, general stress-responsive regulator
MEKGRTMSLADWITQELNARLAPTSLVVTDESHLHAGHAGVRETGHDSGETHFRIDVVSAAFEGKNRVERHRLVNAVLADAFGRGLHALALRARTAAEAG